MTPAQAIRAATAIAAKALGKVGGIAPGDHAGIVAASGDPLENVRLLEVVPFVMKGGEVVKSAAP